MPIMEYFNIATLVYSDITINYFGMSYDYYVLKFYKPCYKVARCLYYPINKCRYVRKHICIKRYQNEISTKPHPLHM